MIKPGDLNERFYVAYHNPNLVDAMAGVLKVLNDAGPAMQNNQHYVWLRDTANRLMEQYALEPAHELPGMLYGMISTAWTRFVSDYIQQFEAHQREMASRGQQVVEHSPMLYNWMVERAWEFFQGQTDPVPLLTNGDLLREISYIVWKEAELRGCKITLGNFPSEVVLKLLNAAANGLRANKQNILDLADDHILDAVFFIPEDNNDALEDT